MYICIKVWCVCAQLLVAILAICIHYPRTAATAAAAAVAKILHKIIVADVAAAAGAIYTNTSCSTWVDVGRAK